MHIYVHPMQLAIYQVTDKGLCDKLLTLYKSGINVTLLVSCDVIPYYNYNKTMVSIIPYTNACSLHCNNVIVALCRSVTRI